VWSVAAWKNVNLAGVFTDLDAGMLARAMADPYKK